MFHKYAACKESLKSVVVSTLSSQKYGPRISYHNWSRILSNLTAIRMTGAYLVAEKH
uniref:Uncharacterized protein n=1 Tax=Arion vulgaris TaxID=1028688 RepID=A0A0B6YCM3_9EUPU